MDVCIHFDAIRFKGGCELGRGRIAPRDCGGCAAYAAIGRGAERPSHEGLQDSERTPCEVWTRVMGYHRPVSQFNPGKQSEHAERVHFVECDGR